MKLYQLFEEMKPQVGFHVDNNHVLATVKDVNIDYSKEPDYLRKLAAKTPGLVGFVRAHMNTYKDVHVVDTVHVIKPYQRQGIMKSLYNALLQHAKSQGKIGIASDEFLRNKESNRFWEKYKDFEDEERNLDIIQKPV